MFIWPREERGRSDRQYVQQLKYKLMPELMFWNGHTGQTLCRTESASCYHSESKFIGPLKRHVGINIQPFCALDAGNSKEQPRWPSSLHNYVLETISAGLKDLKILRPSKHLQNAFNILGIPMRENTSLKVMKTFMASIWESHGLLKVNFKSLSICIQQFLGDFSSSVMFLKDWVNCCRATTRIYLGGKVLLTNIEKLHIKNTG